MNLKINFLNQTKITLSINFKSQIRKIFYSAAAWLKIRSDIEINLIFVNPAKIKKLNWKFRRKNYQTDVLSFKSDIPIKNSIIYADIVICPQIAKKNAVKLNHSLEKEIIILAVHGFLHIADFDHSGLFARKKWDKIFKKLENIIK